MNTETNAVPAEQGVIFPRDADGRRSSTAVVRETFARAVEAVDANLAAAIRGERRWREQYVDHLYRIAHISAGNPETALSIARAGLAAAHQACVFQCEAQELSLVDAMENIAQPAFHTGRIRGQASRDGQVCTVPYKGQDLSGEALRAQLADWEERGIIEPSCGAAVRAIQQAENPDLSGRQFVLLGANSEMGPIDMLLRLGATVIAVDIERPETWLRLFEMARDSAGTLVFPSRTPLPEEASTEQLARLAGANLLTDAPGICAWLQTFTGPMTVGSYAYLDGARHVRVALAMDAIVARLARSRDDLSYAVLLTPTDVYVIPGEVAQVSLQRSRVASLSGLLPAVLRMSSSDRVFARNIRALVDSSNGKRYGIVDCQLIQQGPAYALAKSIQRWRAMVLRADGYRVSANVAAATRTRSVVSNKLFAAAYRGCEVFGVEAFEPGTNSKLMALTLVHDILGSDTAANPERTLDHPLELFMDGANHGGFWRIAYQVRSAIAAAVVAGWGLGVCAPRHTAGKGRSVEPAGADRTTA